MTQPDSPLVVVVDVEGNGRNPPDLVEVAVLPVRNREPDSSTARSWLIRPPRSVTPFAARIHGLTNPDLAQCPVWEQVRGEVAEAITGAWICAHNAHVDYRVLRRHLPGWEPAGVLDTLRLARSTYPDLPRHSLDALIQHERPDLTDAPARRHRAPYDAYATAQLLVAMARRHATWQDLVAAATPPGLPGYPHPSEQGETLW